MDRVKIKEIVTREAKGKPVGQDDTRGMQFSKLRAKTGGRKKGTPNKTTAEFKALLLDAMEMCGSDGEGTDGAVGYMAMIAWEERALFTAMVQRAMPFMLTGKDGGPVQLEYKTKADIVQRMKERGLPIPPTLMQLTYEPRQADETEQ